MANSKAPTPTSGMASSFLTPAHQSPEGCGIRPFALVTSVTEGTESINQ